jgi:hypothetical protein
MSTSGLLNLKAGDALSTDVANSVTVLSANGALTIPNQGRAVFVITKGTAAALTVAAPTATTHDGVEMVVVSSTAAAHTLTATTIGFNAGNTATDVGTFGGAIGDGIAFVAYQGEWLVLNNINVTLA